MATGQASKKSVEQLQTLKAIPDQPALSDSPEADEAQARLAAIVNSSGDAIIAKTLGGRITTWNPGATKLFGYSAAEAIGQPMTILFPPEQRNEEAKILARIKRGENVEHFETVRIHKNGRRLDVSVTISPIKDRAGKVTGASTIARDIAERKQTEAILRAQSSLFDQTYDGALVWSWNGLIRFWNHGAELMYGFTRAEAVGRVSHEMLQTRAAAGLDGILKILEQTGRWEGELEHRTHDGRQIFVDSRMRLIRDAGDACVLETNRDITERKRADERLRRSQAELRSLVEQSPVSIAMFDCAMRYLVASRRWVAEYGHGYKNLVGRSHYEINPDLPEFWKTIHRRGLAGETLKNDDDVWIHADGSKSWLRWAVHPWRDAQEAIGGIIIFAEDITARKRDVEALRQSETKFSRAFANNPAAIALTRLEDGEVIEVNDTWVALTGFSREEIIGRSARHIWPSPAAAAHFVATLHRDGKVRDYEQPFRKKSGEIFTTELSSQLLDFEGEQVVLSTLVDITERKLAQAKLLDSERRFRTLANAIPQLAWIARADGFIFWYNDRWYQYTGATPAQMEGWGWQSVHDPQTLPRVMTQWKKSIALGQRFEMEFPLRSAAGNFRRFLTRALPLKNADGKVEQWFGTNTDVDELKRAEDEIKALNAELEQRVAKRTAELEAANQELEAFSYSVSHDLRAPLRAINGFAGIVIEDFSAQLPDEGRDYLERVRNGGQRMGELIDDLLTFSRLSRQPLERRQVDIGRLVAEVLAELSAHEKDRIIKTRVGNLRACPGDAALLRQVWVNLISNAFKYTRRREQAVVEIGNEPKNGEVIYFVRDNGVGFDMQYAGKLFGVFQRLHRPDEFEGTGVGLAIVQRIVHRHGGQIWAEAKPDHGATFYFTLEGDTHARK